MVGYFERNRNGDRYEFNRFLRTLICAKRKSEILRRLVFGGGEQKTILTAKKKEKAYRSFYPFFFLKESVSVFLVSGNSSFDITTARFLLICFD